MNQDHLFESLLGLIRIEEQHVVCQEECCCRLRAKVKEGLGVMAIYKVSSDGNGDRHRLRGSSGRVLGQGKGTGLVAKTEQRISTRLSTEYLTT